jgi:hypothetical protein
VGKDKADSAENAVLRTTVAFLRIGGLHGVTSTQLNGYTQLSDCLSLHSPAYGVYTEIGAIREHGMPSTATEPVSIEAERAELQSVLASPLFARSPTLSHFLSYLCEKKFCGEADRIKEYSIALEVFGRPPSFDQDTNSIVRVQANRLRKRLADYYSSDGAGHPLQITIPVGQYVPVFQPVRPCDDQIIAGPAEPDSKDAHSPRTWIPWMIVATTIVCAIFAVLSVRSRERRSPPAVPSPTHSASREAEQAMGLPVGDELRILAGASRSYVDRAGKLWAPDAHFSGGKAMRASVQHIWRTQDPSIYRSTRQGDFQYDIPLKPGLYELRLHFAETFYGPEEIGSGGEGSRLMTIRANGKPLLDDYDVILDAGGSRTADVKVFTGVAPDNDGQLHLSFSSVRGGSAMLSAIEILPGLRAGQRPVRISARDIPYYSNDSRWWAPDTYFKGGQLSLTDEPAVDADDPEMYETERWGHFSYAIPVVPGHYTATFYFIEHRFDAANRDRYSGPSDAHSDSGRLFSVFCNGRVILRDINLIKEAGENRPLVRKVSGLEPNAQGKLLLEFVPTRSYATVTAIEIVAQND